MEVSLKPFLRAAAITTVFHSDEGDNGSDIGVFITQVGFS